MLNGWMLRWSGCARIPAYESHLAKAGFLSDEPGPAADPAPTSPTLPQAPTGRRSRAVAVAIILGMGLLFLAVVAGIIAMWLMVEPAAVP